MVTCHGVISTEQDCWCCMVRHLPLVYVPRDESPSTLIYHQAPIQAKTTIPWRKWDKLMLVGKHAAYTSIVSALLGLSIGLLAAKHYCSDDGQPIIYLPAPRGGILAPSTRLCCARPLLYVQADTAQMYAPLHVLDPP